MIDAVMNDFRCRYGMAQVMPLVASTWRTLNTLCARFDFKLDLGSGLGTS